MSCKIHSVGAKLFHVDRQTETHRQRDMTKLTAAFRNFVNAPKRARKAMTLKIIKFALNTNGSSLTSCISSVDLRLSSHRLAYKVPVHVSSFLILWCFSTCNLHSVTSKTRKYSLPSQQEPSAFTNVTSLIKLQFCFLYIWDCNLNRTCQN